MEIIYSENAQNDLKYWKQSGNKGVQKRISALIESISINPTTGIGKPEMLKYSLSGSWSRRITQEHRIVYSFNDERVLIETIKGHY
jgi:toxin YoeB